MITRLGERSMNSKPRSLPRGRRPGPSGSASKSLQSTRGSSCSNGGMPSSRRRSRRSG